jgi:methyl-accepting chemotaxis protein
VELARAEYDGDRTEFVRTVSHRVVGGEILVIGRSLDELVELRQAVARALIMGVIPAVVLTLALSMLVSWRALRRVKAIDVTLDRIIQGELGERRPTRGTNDSFDRLRRSVNGMLDKMSVLLGELRDVGNNTAAEDRPGQKLRRRRLPSEAGIVIEVGVVERRKRRAEPQGPV